MSSTIVKSHWHHPVANFQTSTQDFYAALERGIQPHQIPGLAVSRFEWKEGGAFSAKREYLRIRRGKFVFDVCAAPFGADYFFSWWLAEAPSRWGFLRLLGIVFGMYLAFGLVFQIFKTLIGGFAGEIAAIPLAFISLPVLVWLAGKAVQDGMLGSEAEEAIIDTPIIGWLYLKLFNPFTYYKIDTMQAFEAAVSSSVREVVDSVLTAKGLRPLTELEQKPVMEGFLARSQHAGR